MQKVFIKFMEVCTVKNYVYVSNILCLFFHFIFLQTFWSPLIIRSVSNVHRMKTELAKVSVLATGEACFTSLME